MVYEKVAPCAAYPPDGSVTFSKINIYCDNKLYTPTWTTGFVEDVCNNRATVVDANTIKISWNTKAADPSPELIAASQSKPFAGAAKRARGAARRVGVEDGGRQACAPLGRCATGRGRRKWRRRHWVA